MPLYNVQTSSGFVVEQIAALNYADIQAAMQSIAPHSNFRVTDSNGPGMYGTIVLDQGTVLIGSALRRLTSGIPVGGPSVVAPAPSLALSATPQLQVNITSNTTGAGVVRTGGVVAATSNGSVGTVPPIVLPPAVPPAPPEPDPEVSSDNLAWSNVRIGERQWRFQVVRGGSLSRRGAFIIYLEAAPIKNFVPGSTPSVRAINNWRRSTEWHLSRDNRLLVNNVRNVAYIFGKWRASYAKVIEELLGLVELPATEGDGIEVLQKALDRAQGSVKEEQRQRLIRINQQIENYQRCLLDELRNRDMVTKIVEAIKDPEKNSAAKMLERLKKVEGVDSISVRKEEIFVLTKHIYVEVAKDPRGMPNKTKYDIGKFRIKINLVTGQLEFKNTTRQVGGREHPHITHPTGACLGEISRNIPEFLSKLMVPELIRTLIIYLSSVNIQDVAGATVNSWPVAVATPAETPEVAAATSPAAVPLRNHVTT